MRREVTTFGWLGRLLLSTIRTAAWREGSFVSLEIKNVQKQLTLAQVYQHRNDGSQGKERLQRAGAQGQNIPEKHSYSPSFTFPCRVVRDLNTPKVLGFGSSKSQKPPQDFPFALRLHWSSSCSLCAHSRAVSHRSEPISAPGFILIR